MSILNELWDDASRAAKDGIDGIATTIQSVETEILARTGDATVLEGFPRRIQVESYTCGLECTAMILKYLDPEQSLRKLKRKLRTSRRAGTDESNIKREFHTRGFRTKTVSSLHDLRAAIDKDRPVLVLVDGEDHWCVVFGYSEDGFLVADPAARSFSAYHSTKKFKRRWNKWALVVRE